MSTYPKPEYAVLRVWTQVHAELGKLQARLWMETGNRPSASDALVYLLDIERNRPKVRRKKP